VGLASDGDGPLPEALVALRHDAPGTRFMYLLPNFQNPTGRVMPQARRAALVPRRSAPGAAGRGQPLRRPVVRRAAAGAAGRALARGHDLPGLVLQGAGAGLRLGYVVAPEALCPKLLQAKQAADLHTPASTSAWCTR
jgi:2-aminoadipate transaminase